MNIIPILQKTIQMETDLRIRTLRDVYQITALDHIRIFFCGNLMDVSEGTDGKVDFHLNGFLKKKNDAHFRW